MNRCPVCGDFGQQDFCSSCGIPMKAEPQVRPSPCDVDFYAMYDAYVADCLREQYEEAEMMGLVLNGISEWT